MSDAGLRVRVSPIAGTDGTVALHPARDAGDTTNERVLDLDDALVTHAAPAARLLVAEVPGDHAHRPLVVALEARGFEHAGRIADYVDDGVDLVILRKAQA